MSAVLRRWDWALPVPAARREILSAAALDRSDRPPVLFVPGFGQGAWVYGEHWLEHTAERGFDAYAMSPRGHGAAEAAPRAGLRAYVHDVVQVAAGLARQPVIVGHGAGALVVAHALARYPARAAVLTAPVLDGWNAFGAALRRHPLGLVPAVFGGGVRLRRRQLFGRDTDPAMAREHVARRGRASARAQYQLLARRAPGAPLGGAPVLVVGGTNDRIVSRRALDRAARRYGGVPMLFSRMGHDLMLEARWAQPLDALLDWVDEAVKR